MQNKYVKNLISKMSLDQKIGAVLTLGFAGTVLRPHIIKNIVDYHCGGLRLSPTVRLFGSYVDPKTKKSIGNFVDTRGLKPGIVQPSCNAREYSDMLTGLNQIAMDRPLGIPLHFSFDQEGGTSADYNFGGVKIFPKPMGIRATGDPGLAYEIAKAVSAQSKAVGFNWIHSPVLDVNTDPNNPEVYTRAYSDNPEEVAEYAIESCRGFKEAKMIATGKHFPGRGDSDIDAHFAVPTINVDRDTMLKRELYPYIELIKRDLLPSIMIAHSIFPAFDNKRIATVSKAVLTGLLRDEMGFDGVITTDSMTMGALANQYGVANACALSLEAGADLILMKAENHLIEDTIEAIRGFITSGRISETELDNKVYRVLSTKYEYGMFTDFKKDDPIEVMNDEKIINISKTVARRSVVVDRAKDLPLAANNKMLVIEQVNITPNNVSWHPGILYKNCTKYNLQAEYLETTYTYDDDDKEAILTAVEKHDCIVITNFYVRGRLSNNEFISELVKNKSKKFVIVTNTPYPISVPQGCDNIVVTYATSPDNIEVVAGVLFGKVIAGGEHPVKWELKS